MTTARGIVHRGVALIVVAASALNALADVQYAITDLGLLPGGGFSKARAVSANGSVVGVSGTHAFVWRGGTMTDLGTLGGAESDAYGVNSAGQVVGLSYSPEGALAGFLWQNGVMTALPGLSGMGGWAHGINESGAIVGGATLPDYSEHACLWVGGQIIDLGTLGGGSGTAISINAAGHIAGHSNASTPGELHPFLYADGAMRDLGLLPGYTSARAAAINDRDQVVGNSWNESTRWRPFLWDAGVLTDLGSLAGYETMANSINAAGQVVGYSDVMVDGYLDYRAFIWQNGQMTDLNGLVAAESGWLLQEATGINDSGQIVGIGQTRDGLKAFLLTPIPEPSAAMMVAVVALMCRRLR